MNNVNIVTPPTQTTHNQNPHLIGNAPIPAALQAIQNANLNTPPPHELPNYQDLFHQTPHNPVNINLSPIPFNLETQDPHDPFDPESPPQNLQQNPFQTPPNNVQNLQPDIFQILLNNAHPHNFITPPQSPIHLMDLAPTPTDLSP